jgi:hypothetical protein
MFMDPPATTLRDVAFRCQAHKRRCTEDGVWRGVKRIYEAISRRRFDPKKIKRVATESHVPAPDDLPGWLRYARTIEPDLKGKLTGEVSYDDTFTPTVSRRPRRSLRRR